MDLQDYLKILRRRWLWIVALTVVCAAAAGGVTALQTPQFASSARLFVTTSNSESATLLQGGQFSTQRVKSYADLVSSRQLAETVIGELGLEVDPEELSQQVEATVAVDTVNLTLTVTTPEAGESQRIAQAYAESLTKLVRELETPPGETTAPIKATIVDAASFSDEPVAPQPVRNVGLGLVLGLLLGFGLAVLRETLDTRIRTTADLSEVTDAPVLASIGFDPAVQKAPLITDLSAHSPRAEAFRVLRTNLQFVDVDNPHKVFVVTSSLPEEGKTSTAVNLALSLAQAGVRTLLLDADLRRPTAAGRLGVDTAVGLTNVLIGTVGLADVVQRHEPSGLDVVASGPVPPNPAELLQSRAMADLVAELREVYDVVIVDAPPLLPVTDAALLSAKADGALLLVRHGKTTRDQVVHSVERLEQVDASLVGIAFNMLPSKSRGYGYGYGYGYGPTEAAPKTSAWQVRAGRRA